MLQLIRTFLVWALVLAVPAQGLAAVTMAFCGATHHGAETALSHPAAHPAEHGQGLALRGSAAGHDHQAMLAAAEAATGEQDGSGAAQESPSGQSHKCSVCSTCCSVGALMDTVLAVPEVAPANTVFVTVVTTIAAVAVDGLERPPRAALA